MVMRSFMRPSGSEVCKGVSGVKTVLVCYALIWCCSLWGDCGNAHCIFEYNGYSSGQGFVRDDILGFPTSSARSERYFRQEFLPLRELNWLLYSLEKSLCDKDEAGVTNAVTGVVTLLNGHADAFRDESAGGMTSASGVHRVTYVSPSAGCGRIVPLSEQAPRSGATESPERICND